MSVASYSQASAVYDRSTDHAHHPAKDQPPSYDMATGPQVEGRKSAGDTPPVKALRNGVSGVVLFAGCGNEDRDVKWLPMEGERKSAGDAPRAGAPGNAVGSQKVAPAPEVAANLPSAAALKRQIAQFLQKHFDKDAKKAAAIVEYIPNNHNQVKLNNILNVLTEIRMGNGYNYESLKEDLSWSSNCCNDSVNLDNTTSEERLKLRALMLYMFSDFNAEAVKASGQDVTGCLRKILADCYGGIKERSVEVLEESYNNSFMIAVANDMKRKAFALEPLQTVKKELEAMLRPTL